MAEEIKDTPLAAASTVAPPAEAAAPHTAENATQPVTASTEAAPVSEVKTETKPETLLGADKVETPAEKPVEVKEPEKPAEKQEIAPPVYEPFKLPEGITVDDTKLGDFTKSLSDFELTSKASHEEVQKLGQSLIDRHMEEMTRYTESLTQAWEKQKTDWKDSFLKDPEFANRTDTVVKSAIDAINVYGGDAKQQTEFRELMESSGLGNHPAMIRLLSNIMLAKKEPTPLAAPQIASSQKASKVEKMYGRKV